MSFQDPAGNGRSFADPIELVFAARATASFPGAFPPFSVKELDKVLEQRGRPWPGRAAFLARALPRQATLGDADDAVLIDGSVLANAPFGPCIDALEKRPARREIDRRFVYIDPKPGLKSVRLTGGSESEPPGFFATIFGALSDIPREQPIRDNLEAIERLSGRIRRLRRIVDAMQPEVEAAIERAVGSTFFLIRPTPKRLAAWRSRANELAARSAGYAYAAYAHLKIAAVVEDAAECIFRLGGGGDRIEREDVRQALWAHVRDPRPDQRGSGQRAWRQPPRSSCSCATSTWASAPGGCASSRAGRYSWSRTGRRPSGSAACSTTCSSAIIVASPKSPPSRSVASSRTSRKDPAAAMADAGAPLGPASRSTSRPTRG